MFKVNMHQKEVKDLKKLYKSNAPMEKSGGIRFDQMEYVQIEIEKNIQKIYSTEVSMLIDTCHMMILAFCATVSWMLSTASLGICLCGRNRLCSNNSSCKSHGPKMPSNQYQQLVGGFNPFEQYSSKWESSPNRGENKKYLKPPPRQL